MERVAGIRFDRVLALSEREELARTLRSAGATLTSWSEGAGKTYASASLAATAPASAALAVAGGRCESPPPAVLRVRPSAPERLEALFDALGGAGRPAGVREVRREPDALIVEFSPWITRLSLIVALIDVELSGAPGRRIEPLFPLDDAMLAAFASDLLQEPELDLNRLVETHLEPLLAEGGG